jgi:outer membrane protein
MKKTLLAVALAATAFSTQADMLVGADVEVNAWSQDYKYGQQDDGSAVKQTFAASIEHPIPLVPNVKFARSGVAADSVEYTKTDYILYYELLDFDLVSFDVGAGATQLSSGKLTTLAGTQTFEGTVPVVYASGEVGIPLTPFSVFATGSGVSYDSNIMRDIAAGVKYNFGLGLFTLEIQAGYRIHSFDLGNFDNLSAGLDSEAKGYFAGVNFDF